MRCKEENSPTTQGDSKGLETSSSPGLMTRLAESRLDRAAIKPRVDRNIVLHENKKFPRRDSQDLIIKGINPLHPSLPIQRPHSTDCTETINR